MAKLNKINVAAGISSKQDIRTQQASVQNENARKSEYAQRFANFTQTKSAPQELNKKSLTITTMRYPNDIGIYYMGFQFKSYSQTNLKQSAKEQIVADVVLPHPPNLVDALHQRYEEIQQGLLGGIIEGVSAQAYSDAAASAVTALGATAFATLESTLQNQYALAGANLLRQTLNLGVRQKGLAFNPFLAVFYVAPAFKQHEFVWRFSPKTSTESKTIRDIIQLFHYHMSPTLEPGKIFFGYPNIVIPKLYCGDEEAKFMYEFKPCVIENCIVNYAPNGVPSYFSGTRAPTEIEFRLSLKELDLWLRSDYEEKK